MFDSKVLRDFSYGVYVVSSLDGDRHVGCVANSAMQITQNQIVVSLNHDNYTNSCIQKCGKFAVSVLDENIDPVVIGTFGYQSSRDVDKFTFISHDIVEDCAVLTGSCGYLVCKVVDTMETETHTIFLGEIIGGMRNSGFKPMTYAYYHEVVKGKAQVNFTSTLADDPRSLKKKYVFVCQVCGYRVETDEEELPEDFKCPICGKGREYFERQENL